jgi:hypothetical protein
MKVNQEEDHSGSKDNDVISLQIVESSQVDLDKKQAKMLANATLLTCRFSMFNAQLQTRALDLTKYVDLMWLYSSQSLLGRNIKSYELPGLCGAMAD